MKLTVNGKEHTVDVSPARSAGVQTLDLRAHIETGAQPENGQNGFCVQLATRRWRARAWPFPT